MKYNIMKVLCMFDLPVDTEKREKPIGISEKFVDRRICYDAIFHLCQNMSFERICG